MEMESIKELVKVELLIHQIEGLIMEAYNGKTFKWNKI